MQARLSVVTLGVADLDRSVGFYRGLGLEPAKVVPGEVAFIQLNGLVLCLFTGLAADAEVAAEGRGPGLSALGYNVRDKGEIEAVMDAAVAAGARVTCPPHDTDWGGRTAYFADPDGHLWEVAWNPFWPIDDEGRTSLGA